MYSQKVSTIPPVGFSSNWCSGRQLVFEGLSVNISKFCFVLPILITTTVYESLQMGTESNLTWTRTSSFERMGHNSSLIFVYPRTVAYKQAALNAISYLEKVDCF